MGVADWPRSSIEPARPCAVSSTKAGHDQQPTPARPIDQCPVAKATGQHSPAFWTAREDPWRLGASESSDAFTRRPRRLRLPQRLALVRRRPKLAASAIAEARFARFARPYFDPGLESPTISPVPASAVPERFSETLLKPSNPWTRPGIIRGRPPGPTKFPVGDADPERLRHVRWATVPADGIDSDYGQDGDTSLMTQLADALKEGGVPADWEWAANKTILGVGDSLMRNNVMFFADHISQWKVRSEPAPRRTVPRLITAPDINRSFSAKSSRCGAPKAYLGRSRHGWASSMCPSSALRSLSGFIRAWCVRRDRPL